MGSSPSTFEEQKNLAIQTKISQQKIKKDNELKDSIKLQPQRAVALKSSYEIPELEGVIAKAHKDLHSRDPIGQKRYFFQVVNFIFDWLKKAMNNGMSLYDAECLVSTDLIRACQQYPIGKIQPIKSTIADLKPQNLPNLIEDIQNLNKQKFTDRIKEFCIRSKELSYEFNKKMQLILEKEGGFNFKGGYKNTGVKAYMRILTKILEDQMEDTTGSKQVYNDINHYFWTPIFVYFNKILDRSITKLKVQVYDWMRCRVFYKSIEELEAAWKRLSQKFSLDIFRIKNRINLHTRDVLINLKYQTEYAEIQLALAYDSSAYEFNHKLYELTREKLGVAYCCFTILLNEIGESDHFGGKMTESGYIKKTALREKVEENFQRLTLKDAEKQWQSVQTLLDQWDVVALNTGVIRGSGFQKKIDSEFYGPQIQQMMIIKRLSNDKLTNWINWMN